MAFITYNIRYINLAKNFEWTLYKMSVAKTLGKLWKYTLARTLYKMSVAKTLGKLWK